MAKAKSNYTPEETIALISAWGNSTDSGISTNGLTIAELAAQFGNKWEPKQLIAKLSHEGVYRAKPKTKSGKKPIRKDALSTILGELTGMSEPDVSSMEKANKTALEKCISTIETLTEALSFYEQDADETALEQSDENYELNKQELEESETAFSDNSDNSEPVAG